MSQIRKLVYDWPKHTIIQGETFSYRPIAQNFLEVNDFGVESSEIKHVQAC
jgi:hypothetical protein